MSWIEALARAMGIVAVWTNEEGKLMYLFYTRGLFGRRYHVYRQGHHQWEQEWIATFRHEIDAAQFCGIVGGDE